MRYGVVDAVGGARRDFAEACVGRLRDALATAPVWRRESAPDGQTETLDFVLDLGAAPQVRPAPARYGSWRFDLGGSDTQALDALTAGRSRLESRLVAMVEGKELVLEQGWLPLTDSAASTRQILFDILPSWPARAAAAIRDGGWATLPRQPVIPADHAAPPAAIGRRLDRLRREWLRATTFDIWNVGIVRLERPLARIDDLSLAGPVRWLPARPPLGFVADPFPYRASGRDWVLVEDCSHRRSQRGRISRLDLAAPESGVELEPVIERRGHISYPFVFEDAGRTWCAPEMSSEGGCVLYRLESDGAWRPAHHVLPGRRIVDPTLVRKAERWWLFYTSYTGNAANTALHACWAPELTGPWREHAADPLKWDLATARPAGRPFEIDGRLYRPAQDCRETYGGAVQVMEVVELTPERFREVPVRRLAPDPGWPYPDGLHHLVVEHDRIFFDAKRTRRGSLLWLRAALG